MDGIELRSAKEQDLPRLNELMDQLHAHHHHACPDHFKPADEISLEKSIAEYVHSPDCLVIIAVKNQDDKTLSINEPSAPEIVGFITAHFCELVSVVSKSVPMGSIDELYVVEALRQKGIAKALFTHVEDILFNYGVQQLFVEVWDFNQVGLDLYHKLGLKPHIHYLNKSLV